MLLGEFKQVARPLTALVSHYQRNTRGGIVWVHLTAACVMSYGACTGAALHVVTFSRATLQPLCIMLLSLQAELSYPASKLDVEGSARLLLDSLVPSPFIKQQALALEGLALLTGASQVPDLDSCIFSLHCRWCFSPWLLRRVLSSVEWWPRPGSRQFPARTILLTCFAAFVLKHCCFFHRRTWAGAARAAAAGRGRRGRHRADPAADGAAAAAEIHVGRQRAAHAGSGGCCRGRRRWQWQWWVYD